MTALRKVRAKVVSTAIFALAVVYLGLGITVWFIKKFCRYLTKRA